MRRGLCLVDGALTVSWRFLFILKSVVSKTILMRFEDEASYLSVCCVDAVGFFMFKDIDGIEE